MKKTLLFIFATLFAICVNAQETKIYADAGTGDGIYSTVFDFGTTGNTIDWTKYKYFVVDVADNNKTQYDVIIYCKGYGFFDDFMSDGETFYSYATSADFKDGNSLTDDLKIDMSTIKLKDPDGGADLALDKITSIYIVSWNSIQIAKENIYLTTGGTTGVNGIESKRVADTTLYNAAGQPVGKNYKGLVMQKNGRKWLQR